MITSELMDCLHGKTKRLIINVPPHFLKSISVNVAFVAFYLGHFPEKQIMSISYGQELADKHAADCMRIMDSEWYKALFPRTRIATKRKQISDFSTTRGGGRISTSMTGVMTGRGADLIILDDPIKAQEGLSEKARQAVNEVYSSSILSRLNSQVHGIIIIVMQRLHQDDLCGYVLEKEVGRWNHVCLSVIAEDDETFTYNGLTGPVTRKRQKGTSLNPAYSRWNGHVFFGLKKSEGKTERRVA